MSNLLPNLSPLESLRLLILDVDGVLTDGRTWQDTSGVSRRYFSVRDTMGIRALRKAGVKVAVLCGDLCIEVRAHLEFVGVDAIVDGFERSQAIHDLQTRFRIEKAGSAYVCADESSIGLKSQIGFLFTVEPAAHGLKSVAHYTASRAGGDGAVLEICNLIRNYKQQEFEADGELASHRTTGAVGL